MKKQLLYFLMIFFFFSLTSRSQTYSWYETSINTNYITSTGTDAGSTVTLGGVSNPGASTDPVDPINSFATTNSFTRGTGVHSYMSFDLTNPILLADLASTVIEIKVYFENTADVEETTGENIRLYLREASGVTANQEKVTVVMDRDDEKKWVSYTFDFVNETGTLAQYSNIAIYIAQFQTTSATFLWDDIKGNSDQGEILPALALDTDNSWYFNHGTNDDIISISDAGDGTYTEDATNNFTDHHTEAIVSSFSKTNVATNSRIQFSIPTMTELKKDKAIYKIRVYVPNSVNDTDLKLDLRINGSGTDRIAITIPEEDVKKGSWAEYTFDFSTEDMSTYEYNTGYLFFRESDIVSGTTSFEYLFDALQGPSPAALSTYDITNNTTTIGLYPNPATDNFNINSNEAVNTVSVYSLNGQLIKSFSASNSYDVSNLAPGLYSVKIATASDSKTIKLIKK